MPQPDQTPNPYAPPKATAAGRLVADGATAHVDGAFLVVRNGLTLPPACVKCGVGESLELRDCAFSYRPAWAQFVGAFGIVAGVRRATFQFPVCASCKALWDKWDRIAGPAFLLPAVAVVVLGLVILTVPADSHVTSFLVVVALFVVLMACKSIAQFTRRRYVVSALRIDKHETWLRGVHELAVRAALGHE